MKEGIRMSVCLGYVFIELEIKMIRSELVRTGIKILMVRIVTDMILRT